MIKEIKLSDILPPLSVIMVIATLGFITDTNASKHISYIGNGSTEIDSSSTICNYYLDLKNGTLSPSKTYSSPHDSNSCPENYFMDEGICRLKPSEQPTPPVSVPLCPPGYYAQSGGICEPNQN